MRADGDIKEFENEAQAKKEGYKFKISPEQARELSKRKYEDRVPWVLVDGYCDTFKKKLAPIEKAKLEHFAKYCFEILEGAKENVGNT